MHASPPSSILHSSHNHLCLLSLNCIVLHVLNYTYMAIMMVVIVIPHITLDGSRTWEMVNSARERNVFSEIHLHIPRTALLLGTERNLQGC